MPKKFCLICYNEFDVTRSRCPKCGSRETRIEGDKTKPIIKPFQTEIRRENKKGQNTMGFFQRLFSGVEKSSKAQKKLTQIKKEKDSSDKPVLVMISSEGPPLEDKTFIDRIMQLPEIQREVSGRRCRIRTFGEPNGFRQHLKSLLGPTDPKTQQEMDAYAMRIHYAPDCNGNIFQCTVTNPVDGRKYEVVICHP
ncbi:MAG: hypothetical protein ABSB91_09840 [Sedimentisphaerales bacterium]|jgi:hypothetical protein